MAKEAPWLDRLSFLITTVVILAAGLWVWQRGFFNTNLTENNNAVWYLVRSAGVTSYVLMTASVLWGLALSSRVVKDWSPGVLSMLLHSTLSWLALVIGLGHGLLLMADKYFHYQISDIFVPFTGPYRPLAAGLGTLTFWIALVVTISFALRNRLPRNMWKKIHYTSYAAFALATAHGLMAGTDASHLGFRILLMGSVFLVVVMTGYRMGKRGETPAKETRRPARNLAQTGDSAE